MLNIFLHKISFSNLSKDLFSPSFSFLFSKLILDDNFLYFLNLIESVTNNTFDTYSLLRVALIEKEIIFFSNN